MEPSGREGARNAVCALRWNAVESRWVAELGLTRMIREESIPASQRPSRKTGARLQEEAQEDASRFWAFEAL